MDKITSSNILEKVMSGISLSDQDIKHIVGDEVPEDIHLDYKRELDPNTVREYMSAFANSEGGILIGGIDNKTWEIVGCETKGNQQLDSWAQSCLTPITHYFSPPAKFQVVSCNEKNVLIGYVSRSLRMVPVISEGKLRYFLRFHDQTLEAPEYLISDLILGRREHPDLSIVNPKISDFVYESQNHSASFRFDLFVSNNGLVWAEDVILGLIYLTIDSTSPLINNHLMSQIDYKESKPIDNKSIVVNHYVSSMRYQKTVKLKPFDTYRFSGIGKIHFPTRPIGIWSAALYIISKDSPPIWYQINTPNDDGDLKSSALLKCERVGSRLPVVSFEQVTGAGIRAYVDTLK